MSGLRWLAVLPSVAGLAVSLSALTANAAPVAAQDAFGLPAAEASARQADPRAQFDAQQEAAVTTQARQEQALIAVHVRARRLMWKEERIAARRAARRADRHAAQLAARRAAVAPTPIAASVGTAGMGAFQACVIARESGGNPQVMNSTGHYGLYQFSYSTWVAYGGNPADFGHASVSEQNQVFANAMATPGGADNWAPYDGCTP